MQPSVYTFIHENVFEVVLAEIHYVVSLLDLHLH